MRSRLDLVLFTALALCGSVRAQEEALFSGVCFGPFRAGEEPGVRPPLPSTLRADLRAVQAVAGAVRTYGMSGTGSLVPGLCAELGLRCWPGAWIASDRAANDLECELLVEAARSAAAVVDTVLVGNEVLLRGDLGPEALIERIRDVRRRLTVRVATAEPWHIWIAHPELVEAVDVVVVHVHPYWDEVPVESAAAHTIDMLGMVREIAQGKPIVLGEFGWPTGGTPYGGAVPGDANAARYLSEVLPMLREQGDPYFVFEMWDEAWKAGQEGAVGPHWGLFHADGGAKPKLVQALPGLGAGSVERPPRPIAPERRR